MFRFARFCFFSAVLLSLGSTPGPLTTEVRLKSMVVEKLSEKGFDQVYFYLLEQPANKKPKFSRIPKYPLHFALSGKEKKFSSVLWTKDLAPGDALSLDISIMEQDISHFDPDDELSHIKVLLRNQNGRLLADWKNDKHGQRAKELPSSHINGKSYEFNVQGDGARYKMTLEILTR